MLAVANQPERTKGKRQMQNSIASKTMLAAIELGLPRQGTQLKIEATKIEQENHTEKGTVRPPSITYFKKEVLNSGPGKKWQEVDGLATLKDFQAEYKAAVRALAKYPYAAGLYLAPAPVVDDLIQIKEKYEGKLAQVWMHWADKEYPEWAETAPQRMGAFYDASDFPTLAECQKSFRAQLILVPLAEKEQVARIALISPKSQSLLMAHADATSKQAVAELHKQIWSDLMTPLQKIVTVFEKDKPKIYDTLLGNLMSMVNLIPSYKELCQDPELEAAAAKAKEVFSQMTTDDLRASDEARKAALFQAKDLIAKVTPFARKFA